MPGAPSVYYGSEWALEGTRDRHSDAALRPCLELGEMMERDQSLCAHLSKLARLRQELPALRYGGYENSMIKNEQLVFLRGCGEQRVYVALNLADQEVHVEFRHGEPVLRDWLNGMERFTNDGGRTWLPVPGCSARILVGSPE